MNTETITEKYIDGLKDQRENFVREISKIKDPICTVKTTNSIEKTLKNMFDTDNDFGEISVYLIPCTNEKHKYDYIEYSTDIYGAIVMGKYVEFKMGYISAFHKWDIDNELCNENTVQYFHR